MTQDKMRRIITACVATATVLLVVLLGYLIYQWITIANKNEKIERTEQEIAKLEEQLKNNEEDRDFYLSDFYLQWKIDEIQQKQDLIQGK